MTSKEKIPTFNTEEDVESYISFNAQAKIYDDFAIDLQAVESYIQEHVKPKTKVFHSTKERLDFLIKNDYYDEKIINMYSFEQFEEITHKAYSYRFRYANFMGAFKFYNAYALKTFDGKYYLENYEDRVVMNVLMLANGNFNKALKLLKQIILNRFQPATPTFLNAGRKKRGEFVSCYLLRIEDNMESIGRAITTTLQLSKRDGGVALLLSNLREAGAPIKKIENQSSGIIPIMKLLEDSFSYSNQLGQRQGAGAVYLHCHHPDVMQFLDTKRENADEKIRIKSLSLGLVIPDITFQLAKNNEMMALFSPYDIYQEYGKALSDISVTEMYYELLENQRIKKTFISARKFFQTIAELHFESGYPYILFDDTVNRRNAHKNRIVMSNLCSEIVQPSLPSEFYSDLTFKKVGSDISCNLGSLNIARTMESGSELAELIQLAIESLDLVSRISSLETAPSIKKGNSENHALGLGAMNLHGFLATNAIYYDSKEAVDFTNIFFYTVAYHAFSASNKLALELGKFKDFENTKFADGSYFDKYTKVASDFWTCKTEKVQALFDKYQVKIPTQENWKQLVASIQKDGLANSHLMAIAPTGSISYLSSCTPSLQPVVSPVEVRKEGKLGRIYVPAYKLDNDNYQYFKDGAYELGFEPIINIVAAAQQHVDQAISLTLFMTDKATTRDLNKAYIYAFKKGCSSIYYVRVRQDVLKDSEDHTIKIKDCEVCSI